MRWTGRRRTATTARGLRAAGRRCGAAVPLRDRPRGGFTLIEVMLVVVIALIITAFAMPSFIRAYQSAQIRTAVRQAVLATKYARNNAILHQQQYAMIVDRGANQIQLVSVGSARAMADKDMFLENRTATAGLVGEEDQEDASSEATADGEAKASTPPPTIAVELTRNLPRDVSIRSFRSSVEDSRVRDVHWVAFLPNGMSDGFEMELEDTRGHVATIKVDAITGRPKVEFEK